MELERSDIEFKKYIFIITVRLVQNGVAKD